MLVNVDSEYKIIGRRLRALEHLLRKRHAVSGSIDLPVFREKSSSLEKLGIFEVQVLYLQPNTN